MRRGIRNRAVPNSLALVLCLIGAPAGAAQTQNTPAPAATPQKGDTVSGEKIAPDIKPDALWDGREIVPFKALDDPTMVPAATADFVKDSDYVLGLTTADGESRAYPTQFVWWHHFINDKVGPQKTPVLISYCSVCNAGVRYDPTIDGKPRLFDFYGLYNGVAVMCERETQTVFLLVDGRGVKGPLTGKRLKPQPLLDTTWGQWKRLHPKTLVMTLDDRMRPFYRPNLVEPRGYDRFPNPMFRRTLVYGDRRLPPFDKILGVAIPQGDGESSVKVADNSPGSPASLDALRRAYPIKTLKENGGVINDTIGSADVAVFLDPETVTANAVSRRLDDKTLTFESRNLPDGKTAIYDKETGTRWNIEGVGEDGALAGKTLQRLENHLSQWYGWVAYFPATTLYGRKDPPQPGDPFATDAAPTDKSDKSSPSTEVKK